jgi:hypothetical protein
MNMPPQVRPLSRGTASKPTTVKEDPSRAITAQKCYCLQGQNHPFKTWHCYYGHVLVDTGFQC